MKFLRMTLAVAGAALAVTMAAPQAVAAPEEPVSPMIIGGGNAANAPWAARLFADGRQNCSATIIAPTYILTARHCVSNTSAEYTFRIGSLDQTTGGTVAEGVAITRHQRADLAIVRLDRQVAATYAPLGTASDVSTGQVVQVYGWGATCTGQPEINCQSRLLKVADVRVRSVSCSDYTGGVAVCATRVNGITAGGDSGGPMMGTGNRQVGVASTSDRANNTAYTNITSYRTWIRSVAGV